MHREAYAPLDIRRVAVLIPLGADGREFVGYQIPVATLTVISGAVVLCLQSILLLLDSSERLLQVNLASQLVLLMLVAWWTHNRSGTLINPPLIFVAAIYFWHSTFLTGHYFSITPLFEYTGNIFSYGESYIPAASALVALSMAFTTLGVIVGSPDWCAMDEPPRFIGGRKCYVSPSTGWIIFGVLALITLLYLVFEAEPNFDSTYSSLYTNESETLLYRLYQSTKFFTVIAILILFQSMSGRTGHLMAVFASLGLIFISLLFGSRSLPFIYGLALLVCIDRFVFKFPFWVLALLAVAASGASFVIDQTRELGLGLHILDFEQTGRSVDWLHIFWNAGGVIKTVLRTMEFSVESGLLYGQSFLETMMTLVPRPILEGIGFYPEFLRPSEWLIQNSADVPVGGGLGYSLIAESYLNFGMFGCLLFFPVGWFLASTYFSNTEQGQYFGQLHSFNVAVILALHMRNDFAASFRTLFWSFILVEILRFLTRSFEAPNKPSTMELSS